MISLDSEQHTAQPTCAPYGQQASTSPATYSVCFFDHSRDTVPTPAQLTRRDLTELLTKHEIRPDKEGQLISPTLYKPDATRASENVIELSMLFLDFDGTITLGELRALFAGYQAIIYTTHRHGLEGSRYRVALFLTRPVAASEWKEFWYRASAYFGSNASDQKAKDAARMYYLPSSPGESLKHAEVLQGVDLDPDSLPNAEELDKAAEQAPRSERKPRPADLNGGASVIDAWNAAVSIEEILEVFGYKRRGKRLVRPGGNSPSVVILDGQSYHHSSNDPLCSDHRHDAFSVYCHFEHKGDFKAAVRGAAVELGIAHESKRPQLTSSIATREPFIASIANANEAAEAPENPFKTFSYEDMKNLPRATWLVRRLVVAGTAGMITGDSTSFKTFFTLHMALCIAAGVPFFGNEVKQGPVIYIAAEGFYTLYDRITAACDHLDIEVPKNFHAMQVPVDISNSTARRLFYEAVADIKPDFIVGDTLSQLAVDLDENSNSDMSKFVRGMIEVARELGATIAILHHNGKNTGTFRGASAIRNNVDFHITLERPDEDQLITFVGCAKQRGRPFEPFALQGHEVDLPYTDEFGDPVTTLVFEPTTDNVGAKPSKKKSKSTAKAEKTREALMVVFDQLFAKWGSVKAGAWKNEAVDKRAEQGLEEICGESAFWNHRKFLVDNNIIEETSKGSGLYQRVTTGTPITPSTTEKSDCSESQNADETTPLYSNTSLDVGVVGVESAMGEKQSALDMEVPEVKKKRKPSKAGASEPYAAPAAPEVAP